MSRFVYRALRENEDPTEKISVGNSWFMDTEQIDEKTMIENIVYHVGNGSKIKSNIKRYFISMTEQLECAQKYSRGRKKTSILLIDKTNIDDNFVYIKNNEKLIQKFRKYNMEQGQIDRLTNYSKADSEVLSPEDIFSEHYKVLSPLMEDILDAINITIEKDNTESNKEKALLEFVESAFFDSEDFENILKDTSELNIFEQYFYERYYKSGFSYEKILQEINSKISEYDETHKDQFEVGKEKCARLDISLCESLRVSVLKKLLNSDRILEYMSKYNEEEYKSEKVKGILDAAKEEKLQQENIDNKEIIQIKIYNIEKRIVELELLNKNINLILSKRASKNQVKPKDATSISMLEYVKQKVYNNDEGLVGIEQEKIKKELSTLNKERDELLKQRDILKKYKKRDKLLIPKFKGLLTLHFDGMTGTTQPFNKLNLRTTAKISLKDAARVIFCGETAYCEVKAQEKGKREFDRLKYVSGVESIIGSKKDETVLAMYSTGEWKDKKKGVPEKISDDKNFSFIETEFGIEELIEIINQYPDEFSEEIRKKIKNTGEREEKIEKIAIEENPKIVQQKTKLEEPT